MFFMRVVILLRFFPSRKQEQSVKTRRIPFEFEIPVIFQVVFDSIPIHDTQMKWRDADLRWIRVRYVKAVLGGHLALRRSDLR